MTVVALSIPEAIAIATIGAAGATIIAAIIAGVFLVINTLLTIYLTKRRSENSRSRNHPSSNGRRRHRRPDPGPDRDK